MKKNISRTTNGCLGVTLVELMMAMAVFLLFMSAFIPMLTTFTGGFSSSEARSALKSEADKALNQIGYQLIECKRLFEDTAADRLFTDRVQMGSMPDPVSNSKMPLKEENGVLSPSSASFITASVGNVLFFASLDEPEDVIVSRTGGSTESVRIDTYRFNAYTIGRGSQKNIAGKSNRNLWMWQSIKYADLNRIRDITDGIKSSSTVRALYDRNILYAWNPSTPNVNTAFFTLSSTGGILSNAAHNIGCYESKELIKPMTGVAGGGWRYGVSPNTSGTTITNVTIPRFATANVDFPSGFEVVVIGPSSGRQVFIRLVLIAEGSFKGYVTHEATKLVTVRDIW